MTSITENLNQLLEVDGALAAAVVDYSSGMLLGSVGQGIDLDIAAGGNTEVVRAKLKTMKMLGLNENIEDILITLGTQYHLIRPLTSTQELFMYYVLDRSKANLALARRKLQAVEGQIAI
ncbi:hypothetical protein M2262_000523 [Pseudomonas sp. BIGb0408]|uniref:Roadblock/LC7 domain-containing protein n=1 Tax=Phytopseudomonas flavescens TaxID=29435 RepID=A0A7Y9XRL4_9GAMM|nr:hypothetical protein [Pseudomonas sp. BIGb0408]MCW2290473.1 hypothetical protein [Pseudomonas sp. BIGb0408]NYH74954.1 hypothetical protein [Pseudomonas flavescens]